MKVLFDHDGGIDDLLSLMMLLAMPNIELQGIVVTPADCFLNPAVSATLKILRFFNSSNIEVSKGNIYGINHFPREWRKPAYFVNALPILNESNENLSIPVSEPGDIFLEKKLREAKEPLTILITGPVSNLVSALTSNPELTTKIENVVWMGGALNVCGNVHDYEHDGTAEWNAYWDPPSTKKFFELDIPITLFPLDITNKVPVTMDFLKRLAQQRKYPLSDLAGQCWAMTVETIPSYQYIYYMWDTLSTGYLGAPHLLTFRETKCKAIDTGPSAGRTVESNDGKLIKVADTLDVNGFLDYILTLFKR